MLTLIAHGELFRPAAAGATDVLVGPRCTEHVGPVDAGALARAGLEVETIDARGCFVLPGLVDVHEHLCGSSGEPGFARAAPEIQGHELVRAGITTVVGCVGTDTTTRTMAALVARTKALRALGLSAWCWTGGYPVPPATVTGDVRSDVMLIEEVVGVGEVAIADERSSGASPAALAAVAREAHTAGFLAGKAGLTHFFDLHAAAHVAAGDRGRLAELCRYLCRPPFGQHRLKRMVDGLRDRLPLHTFSRDAAGDWPI